MSFVPPPPPPLPGDASVPTLEYTQRPAGRRRFTLGEMIAWVVIIGVVALVAVRASMMQSQQAASTGPDETLQSQAQMAMGVHQAFASSPAEERARMDGQVLERFDREAHAPEDKLRVAIVAGEFKGKEEALKRLDAMGDVPKEMAGDIATARAIYQGEAVSDEARAAFRAKYQWFGDLLESYGKPESDGLRRATLDRGIMMIGMEIGGFALAGLATLAGLAILIVGIVFLAKRKINLQFTRLEATGEVADRRWYIYGMAVYIGGYVGLSFLIRWALWKLQVENPYVLVAASFAAPCVPFGLGLVLPLLMGQTARQWRQTLGLHTGRGVLREMFGGMVGYLAGMPLMALGLIVSYILMNASGLSGTHPIVRELGGGSYTAVFIVFLQACVMAPMVEELMFRGALFAHLRERFPWWVSAVAMGLIFALVHPQSWVAAPVLASIGITFGAIREWRGSIIGSMTAHAVHNGVTLVFTVLMLR